VSEPRAGRPHVKGYGISTDRKGILSWSTVERAIRTSPRYWIATADADGAPHVIQQWGAWVEGRLYWEGGRTTRWAKNLARDPHVAVTVERAGLAIMIEGRAIFAKPDPELARKIVAGYGAKPYLGYVPSPKNWSGHGLPALEPAKIFAWKYMDFVSTATRFVFQPTSDSKGGPRKTTRSAGRTQKVSGKHKRSGSRRARASA